MKVKTTITFEIEYDLGDNLSKEELLDLEKVYLENNALDFLEDRVMENYGIKTSIVIEEMKENIK